MRKKKTIKHKFKEQVIKAITGHGKKLTKNKLKKKIVLISLLCSSLTFLFQKRHFAGIRRVDGELMLSLREAESYCSNFRACNARR